MKSKKKQTWGRKVDREKAYNLGFHLGARRAIEVLVEDLCIDNGIVAWLLEEKYLERIKEEQEDD